MQNKLQELTEKLYNEGLSKGQQEANEIIAKAKDEAKLIIEKARRESEIMLTEANRQANESKTNADAEMKLAARQVMASVKQAAENAIITKSISPANKAAFNDTDFVKSLIKTAIEKFNPASSENFHLSVILPQEKENELKSFMEDKALKQMAAGIEVLLDKRFNSGFKIAPKGEGYYISFMEQDFENLFREYLRPKMINLLFGDK